MKCVVGLCLLALAAPVLASNPGEPMDCSDWVVVESGLSMGTVVPYPCLDVDGNIWVSRLALVATCVDGGTIRGESVRGWNLL